MNCDCASVKVGIKGWLWLAVGQNMYDSTCTLSLIETPNGENGLNRFSCTNLLLFLLTG